MRLILECVFHSSYCLIEQIFEKAFICFKILYYLEHFLYKLFNFIIKAPISKYYSTFQHLQAGVHACLMSLMQKSSQAFI